MVTVLLQVLLVLALCSAVSGGRRRYSRRKYGRKYPGHRHHHKHHKHRHITEYYEPSYERTYEKEYNPHEEEEVIYEDELDYGDRVVFDTGSRYGGLDLAAALGLTGVGYVANSGGAIHIVGKR